MDILLPRTPGPDDRIPPFADIQALVEQAVVAEVLEYAGWTEAQRTNWKLSKNPAVEETKERIHCALVAQATGIAPDRISGANLTMLEDLAGPMAAKYSNAISLVMAGIGENHFFVKAPPTEVRGLPLFSA